VKLSVLLDDDDGPLAKMRSASIPVQGQCYGFSIDHPELQEVRRHFGECGAEHDFSISLSLLVEESPPNVWFFRFDVDEMVALLVEAYSRCSTNPSRAEIVAAIRAVDSTYDHDHLEDRLSRLRAECGMPEEWDASTNGVEDS
jgi:hypothetical protein